MRGLRRSYGAVTILMAIVMLVILSGITVTTGMLFKEQSRLTGDLNRENQALENAQKGVALALGQLKRGNYTEITDTNDAGVELITVSFCSPDPEDKYPTQADTSCDLKTSKELNNDWVLIYSKGTSDDGEAVRHITTLASADSVVDPGVNTPISGGSTVTMQGNANIINRYGRSSVWAAGQVTFNAQRETKVLSPDTTVADALAYSDPNDIPLVTGSNADRVGVDVVANDQNLAQLANDSYDAGGGNVIGFWEAFLGTSKSDFIDAAQSYGSVDLSLSSENGLYYISGDETINSNDTYGDCTADPVQAVAIVIDGDLTLNGNVDICGILFITGNLDKGNGNADIKGGLVVKGVIDTTGSIVVEHDKAATGGIPAVSEVAIVGGSWKDWLE